MSEAGRLAGRVALVTGAASGIGRAAARRLAADGARVVLADLQAAEGRAAAAEIGPAARFIPCDVTSEEQVRAAVETARAEFGGLHVLISAAGILQGAYRAVDALDLETFARVLDVNVLGTFLFCKHAAPLIEASGGGVVLCVASGAGVRGPSSSLAYGASKAGVYGFCQTLEQQLAPRGIRVNVVCPGQIDTPMKRENIFQGAESRGESPEAALAAVPLGTPEGVAKVLAFLASEDADYLLGTVFTR